MRSISFIPFLVLLASPAFGWPVRRTYGTEPANSAVNSHNSYSGAGGNAPGGSVQAPGPSGPLDILRGGLLNIGSSAHIFTFICPSCVEIMIRQRW